MSDGDGSLRPLKGLVRHRFGKSRKKKANSSTDESSSQDIPGPSGVKLPDKVLDQSSIKSEPDSAAFDEGKARVFDSDAEAALVLDKLLDSKSEIEAESDLALGPPSDGSASEDFDSDSSELVSDTSIEDNLLVSVLMAENLNMSLLGKPKEFTGDPLELSSFLKAFDKWALYRKFTAGEKCNTLPLLLKGEAERYLDEIPAADKDSYEKIVALLNDRYSLTEVNQLEKISKLWELKQLPGDSALSFIENVRHLASQLGVLDDEVRRIVLRGLHPQIRAYVIQHDHDSIENVIKFTKVAENSYSTVPTETNMVEVFEKFDSKLEMLNTMVNSLQVSDNKRSRSPAEGNGKRVRFDDRNRSVIPACNYGASDEGYLDRNGLHQSGAGFGRHNGRGYQGSQMFSGYGSVRMSRVRDNYNASRGRRFGGRLQGNQFRGSYPNTYQNRLSECFKCANFHGNDRCPASGKVCYNCRKIGHFSKVCRSVRRSGNQSMSQ